MSGGKKRVKFRFVGRVQGVGFRYTAYHAASALGVTGWVLNDWDGSVLMEAQGMEEQLDSLVRTLQGGQFIQIDRMERTELAVEEGERQFTVAG